MIAAPCIWKPFDMRAQKNIPQPAPIYVAPKANAGTPDVIRVRDDGYEDIDQCLTLSSSDATYATPNSGLVGSLTDILAK